MAKIHPGITAGRVSEAVDFKTPLEEIRYRAELSRFAGADSVKARALADYDRLTLLDIIDELEVELESLRDDTYSIEEEFESLKVRCRTFGKELLDTADVNLEDVAGQIGEQLAKLK